MNRNERHISAVLTFAFAVAVFLFFRFSYWGHLHAMERFQMFLFTGSYFLDTAMVPGGLSDYIGRFLTQFFLFPTAGAAIIAILVASAQLLAYVASGRGGVIAYALSFVPAACLWIYLSSDYCLVGPAVAILIALSLLILYRKTGWNPYLLVISAPLSYMICGPLAVLYLLPAVFGRNPKAAALSLALALACAFGGRFVWHYAPASFFFGLHYSQYMLQFPTFAWIAAGGTLLSLLAAPYAAGLRKGKYAASVLVIAAIAAALPSSFSATRNDFDEKIFRYDRYASLRDWEGLLELSEKLPSDNALCAAYINIALAKTGTMGEDLFKHYSADPSCLLPVVEKHHFLSLSTAEAYWQIGIPNAALSVWFDCQEAIPDCQRSASISKCIAECYAVDGNMTAAEHYLEPLRHTLFYSRWAGCFDAGAPEYETLRRWSRELLDINAYDTGSLLYRIAKASPDNDVAFAYSMSFCLLRKDLVNLLPVINLKGLSGRMPTLYQEAYLVLYFQNRHSLDNLPTFIEPSIALRYGRYLSARKAGQKPGTLKPQYGDTFWFHNDFVKIQR